MKPGACHKCPHGVAVEGIIQEKFKTMEWDELPCSTCELNHLGPVSLDKDATNHFRNKFSLDDVDITESEFTGWSVERDDWTDSEKIMDLPKEDMIQCFAEFIRMFIILDPSTQRCVSYWLLGQPLRIAAEDCGISLQAVHEKLKMASREIPWLAKLKN